VNGKMFLILVSAVCILAAFGQVLAEGPATTASAPAAATTASAPAAATTASAPTPAPTATPSPTPAPTTTPAPTNKPTTTPAPTSKPTVVATVGAVQITSDRIDGPLKALPAEFPAERVGAMRAKILDDIIVAELIHAYLEARQIPFDQKEYDVLKGKLAEMAKERGIPMDQLMSMAGLTEQRLRDQVRLKTLAEKETAKEKVDAFIKANPTCFNGTKVQASHILVTCTPTASTADQKAAVAKLEKVAADIKAGTVTFEKAAEANSDCPSKAKGGDLGEFDFGSMVPTFAMKAFSMKIGDTSDIVRTQFGFHIIKVTKRTAAAEKPGPQSEETAKNCMIASLQGEVFNQALTTCPIVISETK
jgi:peptidyl-prolyl cis-trans isomerase C